MNDDRSQVSFVDVCERDLDFVLAEEIECSQSFRSWFLERTGSSPDVRELLRVGRSVTTQHGETDLLVVHGGANGVRSALLIENKIAASFTELQPERYRVRGNEGKKNGEWTDFATVLIAPELYLKDVHDNKFDYHVSYEDCEKALNGADLRAQFKRRIFRAACEKAKRPWDKIVDLALTEWFKEARSFAAGRFPDLPLPAEGDGGRAPTSKWITFPVRGFPQSRVIVEIKPHNGVVDLRFVGVTTGDLRRELETLKPFGAESHEAKSGKSASLRTRHQKVNTDQPFFGQKEILEPMLASADQFRKFAEEHKERIMRLLGYDPSHSG
jgi:hypothetical protein